MKKKNELVVKHAVASALAADELIRRSRAAEMLGRVCPRTVKRYEDLGFLTPFRVNSRLTLYRLGDVQRIMAGQVDAAPARKVDKPAVANYRTKAGTFARTLPQAQGSAS
jgi:hypothetical protein